MMIRDMGNDPAIVDAQREADDEQAEEEQEVDERIEPLDRRAAR